MTIELLYPEVCNLYGDLMNVEYLARSSGAEVVRTGLRDTPRFTTEDVALVYMGSVTERGQELVRDALAPHLEALKKRTDAGGVTLVTGNALEIFGEYIELDGGERLPMLGFLPIHSTRRLLGRYNAMYLGLYGDLKIVGFKSQFGHSWGDVGEGLFTTLRGAGLNPDVKPEGVRIGNFMATYLIGPLTVLNPLFAKELLRLMGVEDPKLLFEEEALDAYRARLEDFSDPKRNFTY